MISRVARIAVLGATLIALAGAAQDWPQWRGPERDGHATGLIAPRQWPKTLERRWQVEVGLGHSGPVVVGEDVFVFTRQGEEESIACLALVDGKQRWRQSYPAPYEVNPAAIDHGKGPKSTPAVADGRVVTLGINGFLACWDAASGRDLWKLDFVKKYPQTSPLYGVATSPLIDGSRCIVFIGGHDNGALLALDVRTGRQLWSWEGDGPAYASPVVAVLSKSRQIVTQSQKACIGVNAVSGKLLWKIPFLTEFDQNAVTPLIYQDSFVFSGYNRPVARYRIELQGDKWNTDRIWETREASFYMSSPVASGDRLFGFSQRKHGQLCALSMTTGKTLWTSDGRQGENAAIVEAGGVLWALTTAGELIVFEDTAKQFVELARFKLADSPTWAHPALVPAGILIKDESHLTLWQLDLKGGSP